MIRVVAYGTVRSLTRKVVGSDRSLANFALDCSGTTLRCVAWGSLAEAIPDEGTKVILMGRMASRSFLTQDGQERWVTEVTVQDIETLNSEPAEKTEEEPF
jgi:single-stranded DNA-binding protein